MSPRRGIANGGFTLMEALVAAVVLTLGLILALEGISAGLAASGRVARRAAANALAADMLNQAAAGAAPVPSGGTSQREGAVYTWHLDWAAGATPRKVTCRIEWTHRNAAHSLLLSRLMPLSTEESP